MSSSLTAKDFADREYQAGFVTDIESDTIPRGLNPESRPEQPEEIILGIDQAGKFFLDLGQGARPVADADLPARLTALYAFRTKDKILFLKADQGVQFGRVQEAIDVARKAGVRVVGAITEQKQELFRDKKGGA